MVSGTNINGAVCIVASDGASFVVSNLCLAGIVPLYAEGEVFVRGVGMNQLNAPTGAALGGEGMVVFLGGSFDIEGPCPPAAAFASARGIVVPSGYLADHPRGMPLAP